MSEQDINLFLQQVGNLHDLPSLRALADSVLDLKDREISQTILLNGNHLNPFFVPHQRAGLGNSVSVGQWVYAIAQARITAAASAVPRIIVSAPMKSGSTFISDSLAQALGLPKVNLTVLLSRPYDHAAIGAGPRNHEIDETALLAACLNGTGFVSHHHMLCTPYLAQQADLYNLKFLLLKRNIFDCIASLDDFCRENTTGMGDPAAAFIRYQMPPGFGDMQQEKRVHHILDRFLHFYVQYYVSWKYYENRGLVKPAWISYEDELLADKSTLADRLGGWSGRPQASAQLNELLKRSGNLGALNFNKGVAGRGSAIQGENRERVIAVFEGFKDLADWSEILA